MSNPIAKRTSGGWDPHDGRMPTKRHRDRGSVLVAILAIMTLLLAACGGGGGEPAGQEGDSPDGQTSPVDGEATAAEGTDEPIVLGVIMSLTGPFAPIGQTELNGMQLKVKQINAEGGIEGRQIELEVLDDASDPTRSVTHVRSLINDGVVAILGPTAGPTVAQTTAITKEQGVLQLLGIAQDIPGATTAKTLFGVPPPIGLWSEAAACYAAEALEAETAGGIFSTDTSGAETHKAMGPALESYGIDLVIEETVAIDATDTSNSWAKIRDANPDVAMDFVTGSLGGQTLKTARDLGYEGPILGYVAWGLPPILKLAGEAGNGAIIGGHISAQDPAAHQEDFVDAFVEEYGDEALNNYTAYGYDMVTLVAEALKANPNATQADAEALATTLEEDVQLQGVVADFDYGPYDPDNVAPHSGVELSDIIFFEAEDAANGVFVRAENQPDCS